ncbi:MAG TPA: hypothetical protein VFM83_06750 [Gaiellaceae bacterium]|nr:hypothetical protein [Gaiellaceae bacterium]
MDADPAFEELLRVSEDVRAVVVFERGGEVSASSLPQDEAAEVAGIAEAMLAYADQLRPNRTAKRLEAFTREADVYVVTSGERVTVAIAEPGSTAALVQHDLRTLLVGEYAVA